MYNQSSNNYENVSPIQTGSGSITRQFINTVFLYMFGGLMLTAITAYLVSGSPEIINTIATTPLKWVAMFAPLGMVIWLAAGYHKMSGASMLTVFGLYSIVNGFSFAFILLAYTGAAIGATFAITALLFGTMAVLGWTTKTDLTKMGSILFMLLIGLIIASVVNYFMQSEGMDYIISFIGVVIFTGLTAYDMQKLKRIGSGVEYGADETKKLAIMGALALYLDFVNLFLFLLRFFGGRD